MLCRRWRASSEQPEDSSHRHSTPGPWYPTGSRTHVVDYERPLLNSTMNQPVAIFLCHTSGIIAQPWAEAGVTCYCVDVQHSIRKPKVEGNIHYVWGDVRTWCPPQDVRGRIVFGFAEPPCTHVTVAGARDFRTKGTGLLRDSLEMFSACEHAFKWAGCAYGIENPVGKFSDHMGPPDYTFQPWQYGENYSKKTCLWTGNGFIMPLPTVTAPPEDLKQSIWLMPPSEDRAAKRSLTSAKFARAMFEANAPRCLAQSAA